MLCCGCVGRCRLQVSPGLCFPAGASSPSQPQLCAVLQKDIRTERISTLCVGFLGFPRHPGLSKVTHGKDESHVLRVEAVDHLKNACPSLFPPKAPVLVKAGPLPRGCGGCPGAPFEHQTSSHTQRPHHVTRGPGPRVGG